MTTLAMSYLCFSKPQHLHKQRDRRLIVGARAYCNQHGIELDVDMSGVAAFRGDHPYLSALGHLAGAVEAGTILHGTVVILESCDAEPKEALSLLAHIIHLGLRVVTLWGVAAFKDVGQALVGGKRFQTVAPTASQHLDLSALAARLRRLITENDPDAVRAGLAEIAAALDAITLPATPP